MAAVRSIQVRVFSVSRGLELAAELQRRLGKRVTATAVSVDEAKPTVLKQLLSSEILVCDPPLMSPHMDALLSSIREGRCSLSWMHSTYAGVDAVLRMLPSDCMQPPFRLTRTTGYGPAISSYVLAHVLAREHHIAKLIEQQSLREWVQHTVVRRTEQLSVMILGASGDIGQSIAAVLKQSLGAKVYGMCSHIRDIPNVDVVCDSEGLPDNLGSCHYVINILPSTPKTQGLLSEKLQYCRDCCFINVGRGDVVSESALMEALDRKWLEYAVLDVFINEPLPQTNPLWSRRDVLVTPHHAGPTSIDQVASLFEANFEKWQQGSTSLSGEIGTRLTTHGY